LVIGLAFRDYWFPLNYNADRKAHTTTIIFFVYDNYQLFRLNNFNLEKQAG